MSGRGHLAALATDACILYREEGGDLQAAADQLRAARVLVQTEPGEAVGKCRQVIEGLVKALKGQGFKGIAGYLEECTDARRGEEYGNIVFAIKRLTSMPRHIMPKTAGLPIRRLEHL